MTELWLIRNRALNDGSNYPGALMLSAELIEFICNENNRNVFIEGDVTQPLRKERILCRTI